MKRVFHPVNDYDEVIYDYDEITFHPGLTCLVGCNGAGKSTLIRQMKNTLKGEDVPYYDYQALVERRDFCESAMMSGDTELAMLGMSMKFWSEGEELYGVFEQSARFLGQYLCKRISEGASEGWIFLDSFDSGASIDNLLDIRDFLDNTVLPDSAENNLKLYIVAAVNAFEFVRDADCIDVQTGVHVQFDEYENYKEFVIASRKQKDARRDA